MLDEQGTPVQTPADEPAVLQTAACCALCNDSSLSYNAGVPPLPWLPCDPGFLVKLVPGGDTKPGRMQRRMLGRSVCMLAHETPLRGMPCCTVYCSPAPPKPYRKP